MYDESLWNLGVFIIFITFPAILLVFSCPSFCSKSLQSFANSFKFYFVFNILFNVDKFFHSKLDWIVIAADDGDCRLILVMIYLRSSRNADNDIVMCIGFDFYTTLPLFQFDLWFNFVRSIIYTCRFSSSQFYIDSYIVFSNNRCVRD